MLVRAVPVLLAGCSAFKFASTLEHVAQLNARNTPRGHSGKFVTVYPDSDEEAVRLAAALHEATAGLAGPTILSDRPYAPGSLVHYRYGAFVEERKLSNDGLYSWVIFDPDGNPVEDRRGGTFQPPPWAPPLFPIANCTQENGAAGKKDDNQGVLIGDRFLVREAIRHSNKGGVYRAVDTDSGVDAVIKEARPYVAADDTGQDVRDLIRAEARALEKVEPLGIAPRLLKLFEQSSHVFLAEELIPGVPLRQWVLDEIRNGGWRHHVPGALEMAGRVVELMDVAHQTGLILRDFNPNNIMVRPNEKPQLIDLELAVIGEQRDAVTLRVGTPGFSAPEQLEGAPPAVEADYYSLGATLCFILTGTAPCFLQDQPTTRPLRERLADWLTVQGETIDLPSEVHDLILGLMDDEPWKRWSTSAARRVLAVVQQQSSRRQPRPSSSPERTTGRLTDHQPGDHQPGDHQWQEAVDGCVNYLLTAMNPADQERLWSTSCAHGQPDPCILQLGAAGVLGVLTRYFELTGDQRLPEVITTAGRWITRRREADPKRPPGLYFGESGIAWSLYEAGRAVGDPHLIKHALAVADTLPVSAENPDLTQGTAGIGLTFLHLWLRTHDEKFAQQAGKAADELIASASEEPSGISWGAPAGSEWRLAGERYHGFAHGTAGVGYFLLAMALATGRPDCLALANRAGETLLTNATLTQETALWGSRVGDDPTAPYWCHGSAGIATFLTRLNHATEDDRYTKIADLSAQAVMQNSWRGVLGQCHGLAGNGDLLLDLADLAETANGQPYETMAHQLARIIFTHRAYQNGCVVFPDEHGELCPTWGDGVSGVLAFLLRVRYRSPRMWMVDQLLERSHHS
ncbi:MAG: class IV lanthionine synthetase LanL [Pseudonocardiales bacterium]